MQLSYTRLWFIEGKLLAQTEVKPNFHKGRGYEAPCSYAFFCQGCGDIWARVVTQDAESPSGASRFFLQERQCRKHLKVPNPNWGFQPQACLQQGWWDKEFNASIPAEVLRWELLHLADAYIEDFSPTKEQQ